MSTMDLVRERRALDHTDEVPPDELQHRDEKIQQFMNAIEPIEEGSIGDDVRISGPSGAGKSTLAKFCARRASSKLGVDWVHVNCLDAASNAGIAYRIAADLGLVTPGQQENVAGRTCRRAIDDYDTPVIVILDEVQHIENLTVLQQLYHISELAVVTISTREEVLFAREDLDEQIQSRLKTGHAISLQKYSQDELVDILQHRIDVGLRRDVITDDAVRLIADSAAGNARAAIATLAKAVKHVQRSGDLPIDQAVVAEAEPEAREMVREQRFASLPESHKRVHALLLKADEPLSRSRLQEVYSTEFEDVSKSSILRYMETLLEYDYAERVGDGKGTAYRAVPV